MTRGKNFKTGGAGKRYFSFFYNTLKLFEYMYKVRMPSNINQLMKFRGIHVQRRDRIHQIMNLLIGWGWVEPVLGNPVHYRVTEKGEVAYPKIKIFLEFYEGFRFSLNCLHNKERAKSTGAREFIFTKSLRGKRE